MGKEWLNENNDELLKHLSKTVKNTTKKISNEKLESFGGFSKQKASRT